LVFDTVVFSGKTGHSTKQLDFSPLAVLVDPEEKMMDATIDNFQVFDSSQEFIFPKTYFKIIIDELPEQAFVQATHNWVYPDSLKEPNSNLRLSPTRYWKIEGYLPDEIQASGRFYYDNDGDMDGELITSKADSVVILYRENTADDWHSILQNRVGIWNIGHIFVDELKQGEYTLAVHDISVGQSENNTKQGEFKVYPNPSKGKINFDFNSEGNYFVKLIDPNGVTVDSLHFSERKVNWEPQISKLSTGIYLLYIYNSNQLISVEKLLFVK